MGLLNKKSKRLEKYANAGVLIQQHYSVSLLEQSCTTFSKECSHSYSGQPFHEKILRDY